MANVSVPFSAGSASQLGDVEAAAKHLDAANARCDLDPPHATVRIWDAKTFEQLLVLRGHEQYVKDVEWSPDGTMLASASGDATIRL